MYEWTKGSVISPDGKSKQFNILAGLLHGDTLVPHLFAIVFNFCMLKAVNSDDEKLGLILEQGKSRRIGPKISWMSILLQLYGLAVGAISFKKS